MNLPMELLLVLGVIALYLQDSVLLLHYDEIALTRTGSRWRASAGGPMEFRGRRVFVPDPLRPAGCLFRCSWLGDGDGSSTRPARTRHFIASLGAVAGGCRVLWALLLVGLPLLLWAYAHPLALLALLVIVYATTAWIAFQVWRHRRVYGLESRQALAMGFELLCCPPHAINVVRRLSLRHGLHGDAVGAVAYWLDRDHARRTGEAMRERLSYAMAFRGDDAALLRARERIEELA